MHDLASLYAPFSGSTGPLFGFMGALLPLFIAAMLWTIILKGFALWHVARAEQKGWFVALLVINTFGILEAVYLIWFRQKSDITSRAPARDSSPQ